MDDDLEQMSRGELLSAARGLQSMRGCVAYRTSLDAQAPDAPRMTREFGEGPRS